MERSKMIKKIIVLLCLFWPLLGKALTYEGSFKGGEVIDGVFIKKVDQTGNVENKVGQFIVNQEGEYVYCLEPFVKVNKKAIYNVYEDNYENILNMDEATWEKINLISYYGYQYQDKNHNHMDSKWYYVTQMLIWEEVYPQGSFYFTDSLNGSVDENLFKQEKEEILQLVDNHYVIPEFLMPDAFIGDTLELEDLRNVLDNYEIVGNNATINDNKLIIKVTNEEMEFKLQRKVYNTPMLIFVSESSQNIFQGSKPVITDAGYKIYAKKPTGKIVITKYGEKVNIKDEKIAFYVDYLKNVIFRLYDANNNLVEEQKSDDLGKVIFDNLEAGKYFLEEVALDGYKIVKKEGVELKLDDNNRVIDISKKVYNELKKGSITIVKQDSETKEALANVKFGLYKDGQLVFQDFTNEEGILKIDNLPIGVYEIRELKALNHYKIKTESEYVDVLEDSDQSVIIFNIPDTQLSFMEVPLFLVPSKYKKKL